MSKRLRSASPELAVASKRRIESAPVRAKVSVFVFRRDLRVSDNTALLRLCKEFPSLPVVPAFFFNPRQIDASKNPYFGAPCVRFMMECLVDLQKQLNQKLAFLYGSDESCFKELLKYFDVQAVGFNRDYTPFSRARDDAMGKWLSERNISVCASTNDYTLLPADMVVSGSGRPYAVFTPYYKKCVMSHLDSIPRAVCEQDSNNIVLPRLASDEIWKALPRSALATEMLTMIPPSDSAVIHGGRKNAQKRLEFVQTSLGNYEVDRNNIGLVQRTSLLSPFMKFGCVSVREVYDVARVTHGVSSCFVRELFWREFYAMLLFHTPALCGGQLSGDYHHNMPFQEKFAGFRWKWDEDHWKSFQEGRTGVPLVDAAVRCLNATGWCHNRCRMVIGSFATKVLFVDWRVCERWFATKAVDYDVASNSGGWQWVSGQGADAMPYFRTFNPFTQAKKFDEDCTFIKAWIPELTSVDVKTIHAWDTRGTAELSKRVNYPLPIVKVSEATKKVIAEYAKY